MPPYLAPAPLPAVAALSRSEEDDIAAAIAASLALTQAELPPIEKDGGTAPAAPSHLVSETVPSISQISQEDNHRTLSEVGELAVSSEINSIFAEAAEHSQLNQSPSGDASVSVAPSSVAPMDLSGADTVSVLPEPKSEEEPRISPAPLVFTAPGVESEAAAQIDAGTMPSELRPPVLPAEKLSKFQARVLFISSLYFDKFITGQSYGALAR